MMAVVLHFVVCWPKEEEEEEIYLLFYCSVVCGIRFICLSGGNSPTGRFCCKSFVSLFRSPLHCLIEEPWCIVVWHLDIKCLLCVLVSLQRHTEAVEHLLFMYIYGRGSLCRLIGILGLTMARDHRKLVYSGAGCTESNNAAVISELSIWCASLFISIWPWTAE